MRTFRIALSSQHFCITRNISTVWSSLHVPKKSSSRHLLFYGTYFESHQFIRVRLHSLAVSFIALKAFEIFQANLKLRIGINLATFSSSQYSKAQKKPKRAKRHQISQKKLGQNEHFSSHQRIKFFTCSYNLKNWATKVWQTIL